MANGMILRGEVYWVSLDDSTGSEIKTGRPAVVVSGDTANEKEDTVIVAFITSGGIASPYNVSVVSPEGKKRVLCRQLRTVAKTRLTKYEYKLSGPEMVRVTGALSGAMCIPLRTPESTVQEKENKEITALKAECEMWKRSYDVVMTQLVELKVNSDLALRMARVGYEYEESEEFEEDEAEEESPVVEPEPPKEPEPEETERVEINTCSAEDLKRCGCNLDMAQKIMDNRPYMRLDELRIVDGITGVAYGILKHKLCCVPVKAEEPPVVVEEPVVEEPESPVEPEVLEKVNINTAALKEMMDHLKIGYYYASKIRAHRNKNGKFVALEELKMVDGLSKDFYERYAHLCTIGESEPVVESPVEEVIEEPKQEQEPERKLETGRRLNINTASAQEMHDYLGLSMTVCYSITGTRARNGLYKSIEELRQVPRFAESHWEKYKDMITVGDPEPQESEEQEPESDKVNINTASLRDLMAVGFEKRAAALIVNERKKYGRFRSLDDLAEIPEIKGKVLRKLREKLEV